MKKLFTLLILLIFSASVAMAQFDRATVSFAPEKNAVKQQSKDLPLPPAPLGVLQGGEDISTATVIPSLPYTDIGSTDTYLDNYNEVCPGPYTNVGGRDVVYSYTPAASGLIDISLCGDATNFDTKLYVYDTPTPVTGDAIACNEDYCITLSYPYAYVSELSGVPVAGGITYYIVVDAYSSYDYGTYELSVIDGILYPVPPNDDCSGATVVSGPFPQTVNGTTLGATIDCPGVLDWNAVWYAVSLPYAMNNLTVDWCGTENMTNGGLIYFLSCPGDCNSYIGASSYVWPNICGTPPGANTVILNFLNIAGPSTIYFPAWSQPQMDHVITFNVVETPSAPGCGNTNLGVITPTTTEQLANYAAGDSYYWSFSGTANVTYTFSNCGSGEDTYLRIYNSLFTEVASNNDNGLYCSTTEASLDFTPAATGTYYVSLALNPCDPLVNAGSLSYYYTITGLPCGNRDLGLLTMDIAPQLFPYDIGDTYYWSFDGDAGATYTFSTCGSNEDTYLRIYNGALTLVASNDDYGPICTESVSASLNYTPTASGSYYVSVAHFSCNPIQVAWSLEYYYVPAPTCPAPTLLTAAPGLNNAILDWTENGSALTWDIEYGETPYVFTGTPTISGIAKPYDLQGLTSSTEYVYQVRAICGSESSDWSTPLTFATLCDAFNVFPWNESFQGTTFPPLCWSRYSGLLAAPSTLTPLAGGWSQRDWRNVVIDPADKAANINIWSTTTNYWLTTPALDLGTGMYQLEFDLALLDYYTSNPITSDPNGTTGIDDKFAVIISLDGGITWTSENTLRLWDNAGSPYIYNDINYLGEHVILPLTAYSGDIMIGFYGESTISNADNDLMINNVKVVPFTTCNAPTNLQASNIGISTADVNWTPPGGDWQVDSFFDIFYDISPFDPETEPGTLVSGITDPAYSMVDLSGSTTYDVYARTVCQGFVNPKVDNFWLGINSTFELEPGSGGFPVDEAGETGTWLQYLSPLGQSWYNIWFYNDPVDITRMKIIRMGFQVQYLDPLVLQANIYYVVNWSTPDYITPPPVPGIPGYPLPGDEIHIMRSPVNGPFAVDPDGEWMELYFVIPDFNPEWVSVDIWGDNILIPNMPVPPPVTSPLYTYYNGLPGGMIVHECLPKPSGNVSPWSAPLTFTTMCNPISAPVFELFTAWPPVCWDMTGGTYDWIQYIDGSISCAVANYWSQLLGNTDVMTSPQIDISSLANPVLSFDWSHYYMSGYPTDALTVLVSGDLGLTWTQVWYKTGPDFNSNDGAGAMEPGTFVNSGEIDLSAFGNTIMVRFYGYSGYGPDAFVDNVVVSNTCDVNTWTGLSGVAWNDPGNWSCGMVPNDTQDVSIPAGLTNYPVIPSGFTAKCFSINVELNATFTVSTGANLLVVNP